MSAAGGAWDYVVIGAGSAGCALAYRLSADPAARVLLLEAGGRDLSPILHVPAAEELAMGSPRHTWTYRTEPDPTRGGRTELWQTGRVLGGSSAINGMVFLRGHRADYDRWAQLGATGWDYDSLLPYFRRAEASDRGADPWRGGKGPLSVAGVRSPHPLAEVFLAANAALGVPRSDDLNGAAAGEGAALLQVSQRRGWRHSAARAYLGRARGRRNLRVITGALVHRVRIENGRATAVAFSRGGRLERATCGRAIVSAGALGSPKVLMLSGIGDPARLRPLGIEVVAALPGVGANLQEHPGIEIAAEVSVRTYNVETRPLRAARHGLDFLLRGRGPGSTPVAHAVAYHATRPGLASPDIQFHFVPFGYLPTETGVRLHPRPAVTIAANLCRPEARGRLELRSADPRDLPVIRHEMLAVAADLDTLRRGGRFARDLFRTEAFAPFVHEIHLPGAGVDSDADWARYIRETAFRFNHPAGTCRIGQGADAVVDPSLKVRGVEGLYVADASVMPTLPGANTNAAAIMIGEKAADLVSAP